MPPNCGTAERIGRGKKKKKRERFYMTERDEAQVLEEKKEKCLCPCMSDDTDYTVVILDWSLDLLG